MQGLLDKFHRNARHVLLQGLNKVVDLIEPIYPYRNVIFGTLIPFNLYCGYKNKQRFEKEQKEKKEQDDIKLEAQRAREMLSVPQRLLTHEDTSYENINKNNAELMNHE